MRSGKQAPMMIRLLAGVHRKESRARPAASAARKGRQIAVRRGSTIRGGAAQDRQSSVNPS